MVREDSLQIDLGDAGVFDKVQFRDRFGGVFEHSPWLADAVFDSLIEAPVKDNGALIRRFKEMFLKSKKAQQLSVLKAHPELACKQAAGKALTDDSREEQHASGLDQCSEYELNQFLDMNHNYMIKNKV